MEERLSVDIDEVPLLCLRTQLKRVFDRAEICVTFMLSDVVSAPVCGKMADYLYDVDGRKSEWKGHAWDAPNNNMFRRTCHNCPCVHEMVDSAIQGIQGLNNVRAQLPMI